ALDWVDKIFQKVDILKSSPELGRVVAEIRRKDVRELIFGNYRIIYRVEKTSISILTVRHGKQILPVEEIEEMQV
ncbi:MAG: type II toxin-antitoxin system RelE/ParE family toxin, partial [Pseudomonadota bacterium]|nr:type II toxin-antitoxin system RelE/ParE family toxin [Pseudomonadota bacterium]